MNGDSEVGYKVALSMVPGMTAQTARAFIDADISFDEFFSLDSVTLSRRLGITGSFVFPMAERQEALRRGMEESVFMRDHHIRCIFLGDESYPSLLDEMVNAPVALYVLGDTDLDARHMLALVGTRKCTAYGSEFTRRLVADLAPYYPDMAVVSGLALGIDAAAHGAALENGLATIAVVAHGLDMIYPAVHRGLARKIIESGGAIVSEYPRGTRPFQRNFLERNRIVAALCSVTFVVESEVRGGAMSTASQAFHNNREVMALPGRASDPMSAGCNFLIHSERAHLVTSAAQFVELSGWVPQHAAAAPRQLNLFPELDGVPKLIYDTLRKEAAAVSLDRLFQLTNLGMKDLMVALTEMEFDGIVHKLPGARYELA